ncbi:MAG: alpha/beta hydrolase [Vicinamibacterales bacterium]
MSALRLLGRPVGVLLLTGAVYVLAFVLVFRGGSSPQALAWLPSLAAAATVCAGLLLDWPRKARYRRIIDGLLTLVAVGAVAGAAAWLSGWFAATPAETPMAAAVSEGYVATSDGAIFFHQSAAAGSDLPALLVLHGGPGSGSVMLRAQLGNELGSSFRTIFFDQRGVGRSSAASSFGIDDYVDDIERLRRALKVDSWYLFGVSWGAALADEYAVRNPDRVRGIVTWGGLVANQPVTGSMLRQLHAFYAARDDDAAAAWCESLERQSSPYTRLQTLRVMNAVNRARLKTVLPEEAEIETILAAREVAVRLWGYAPGETGTGVWATAATFMQAGLEAYDFRSRLPEIRAPYLFLVGEHDPLLQSDELPGYAEGMPRATLRRIAGAGHTLDQPHTIAREIIAFVKAHP